MNIEYHSNPILPVYKQPSDALWEAAGHLPTPALIYDFDAIMHCVRAFQEDVSLVPAASLNLALKACHTPGVLKHLAGLSLGCDVASIGELELALTAGFKEISATGPAFSIADFSQFRNEGIIPDVDSISQLEIYGTAFPGSEVGLRFRIAFPKSLNSDATFGLDSRFGINPTDPRLATTLAKYDLTPTRIHVHTGQMAPEVLLYKTDWLLTVAAAFPSVSLINMGGGFYHFYVDRVKARNTLITIGKKLSRFQTEYGRSIDIRFEPGSAILGPCGYLVAEVRAVDTYPLTGERMVTLNASAWNLAPWHKPQVFVIPDRESADIPGLLCGNTLYENDFFARDIKGKQEELIFPECQPGDRIVLTVSGAYTMTNKRTFNRLTLPGEYYLENNKLSSLEPVSPM